MKQNTHLKVIVGGAHPARHIDKKKFVSGFVTDSRLMGVLVVYLQWELAPFRKESLEPSKFHQFFYVEATEIGIESYRSLYGDDALAMFEIEQAMLGGLGSGKVEISEREAILLIRGYAEINQRFGEPLPGVQEEYADLLRDTPPPSPHEEIHLFRKTCLPLENDRQLINYFLMRYFAGDQPAVNFLSKQILPVTLSPEGDPDTLCMNKIEERDDQEGHYYLCESLVESDEGHRIVQSEIRIEGKEISYFDIIGGFRITSVEAAMKLERPEFITVYEILTDVDATMDFLDAKYPAAMKRDTEEGRLYLNFKENNNHVKESIYRLNDDVKGMHYVTIEGQLILATYSLSQIHRLEKEVKTFPFGKQLLPVAKYEFKEDVFYDFVKSDCGDFVHFIEYLCDFDPESEE